MAPPVASAALPTHPWLGFEAVLRLDLVNARGRTFSPLVTLHRSARRLWLPSSSAQVQVGWTKGRREIGVPADRPLRRGWQWPHEKAGDGTTGPGSSGETVLCV